jgi:hypothetical protein
MSSSQIINSSNIDEFGRDMSLRKPKTTKNNSCVSRFKGMAWSDICDFIEEEEERSKNIYEEKKRQEELVVFRKIHAERKLLFQIGEYELEEGEELDM